MEDNGKELARNFWAYFVTSEGDRLRVERVPRRRGERPAAGGVGTWAEVKGLLRADVRPQYGHGPSRSYLNTVIDGLSARDFFERGYLTWGDPDWGLWDSGEETVLWGGTDLHRPRW